MWSMPGKRGPSLWLAAASVAVVVIARRRMRSGTTSHAGTDYGYATVDQPERIWEAVNRATTWSLQGEATVQQRYYNFRVADSVLLLSWATLYASHDQRSWSRTAVLIVLATLSSLFAAMWTIGGEPPRESWRLWA
jgi:hypothetical protein